MRVPLLLALSAPVCAHDVHVVGSTPPDFPDIQSAINAAADGDAVVVHPGTYPGFTLAGKGVRIVGLEEDGARPLIDGDVAVQGLAAAQTAVVRGFDLYYGVIALTGNTGPVLLEDFGGYGAELDVASSLDVVLVRTFFYTIEAQASSLHAYEAEISGASDGKTALKVIDGFAFLSGSLVVGGLGAAGASGSIFWPLCSSGGPGGTGLYLQNSQVYRLDTVIAGGAGGPPGIGKLGPPCSSGPPGSAVIGSGLVTLPGTARDFEVGSPGIEDEHVHLRAEGAAGEFVYVLVGPALDPLWFPAWSGSVAVPFTSSLLFLGVVPAWGEIETDVLVGELGPGLEGLELFVQAAFVSVPGQVVVQIGPPSAVELLDRNAILIDCNGNGVQDKTDIASGTSLDCNGNEKPDECDITAGVSADCNGNAVPDECDIAAGTSHDANGNEQPDECDGPPLVVPTPMFPTLKDAVSAAHHKSTVVVRDGTYSGADFQELWVDKDIIIQSEHGPGSTVLAASGFAFAFRFREAPDTATLRGFTLRGFAEAAVLIEDGGARIQDCVFEDNAGKGAVKVDIGVGFGGHDLLVEECTFKNNRYIYGSGTGAITAGSLGPPFDLTVSRCLFTGNVAEDYEYGALRVWGGSLTLRNSVFTANSGPWGIVGQSLLEGSGHLLIQGVTIAGNSPGSGSPALAAGGLSGLFDLQIANSIVWGNSPGGAPEIELSAPLAVVQWTDVEGGAAGVLSWGGLAYGPGNLDVDPLFVSLAAGDLHLSPASPCINAGDPGYTPLPKEKDIDGEGRVFGPAIDMGADEVQP